MNRHSDDGILDLGDPQQMVGQSGFTRGGGGGICAGCNSFAAVLLSDNKCVRCTTAPVVDAPLSDDETCHREDKGNSCKRRK